MLDTYGFSPNEKTGNCKVPLFHSAIKPKKDETNLSNPTRFISGIPYMRWDPDNTSPPGGRVPTTLKVSSPKVYTFGAEHALNPTPIRKRWRLTSSHSASKALATPNPTMRPFLWLPTCGVGRSPIQVQT